MRGLVVPSVLFLLALGAARESFALGGAPGMDLALGTPRQTRVCTVTVLDSVSMAFVCRTGRATRQYWVARGTRFAGSRPDASFFNLATGQRVQVTFHNAGSLAIADTVRF